MVALSLWKVVRRWDSIALKKFIYFQSWVLAAYPNIGIYRYYLTTSFHGGSMICFFYLLSEWIFHSHLSITFILYLLSSIFELMTPYLLFGLYPNRVRSFVLRWFIFLVGFLFCFCISCCIPNATLCLFCSIHMHKCLHGILGPKTGFVLYLSVFNHVDTKIFNFRISG